MNPLIVIPTVHADDLMLQRCIDLVVETTGEHPVVESGGTFAENCNQGVANWDGDVLVFLNDDTEPQAGWLDALTRPFASEEVGITGARLLYPDGRLQHAGIDLTVEPGWNAHNRLTEAESGPVHAVTGACLAIRRPLFERLGGFHEGYRNGAEDVDLCLQAWAAGATVWYAADATVIHHESQSPGRWDYLNQNVELFRSRWAFSVGVHWTGDPR